MFGQKQGSVAPVLCALFLGAFIVACDDGGDGNELPYNPPVRDAGGMGMGGAGGEGGMGGAGGEAGSGGEAGQGGTGGVGGAAGTGGSGGSGGQGGAGGSAGEGGSIQGGGGTPGTGELVITEIMYNPHGGLTDEAAEWIELYNSTDRALELEDCVLADPTGESPMGQLVVESGAYVLFARNNDPAVNGGLNPDGLFDFALNNNSESLSVSCAGVAVDSVRYDVDDGYPQGRSVSLSLALDRLNADANDNVDSWCLSRATYLNDPPQWGTPGEANTPCEGAVDVCRVQSPLVVPSEGLDVRYRDAVHVQGRVSAAGITDLSTANDAYGLVVGHLGFGPDGTGPQDNEDWIWIRAFPNSDYAGDEAGFDEYDSRLFVPVPGEYDFAYRFSVDAGRTWTYCDGGQGSADGYSPADAGALTALPPEAPCDPNPCNFPPRDLCEGEVAISYSGAGSCAIAPNGLAECSYEESRNNCAEAGQFCRVGRCFDEPPMTPRAGQVVISEILYDPQGDLEEDNAEWIELHNTTEEWLNLDGCVLTDFSEGREPEAPANIEGLLIGPRSHLVFARSFDRELNGGIAADGRFFFNLTNSGDTIILRCDALEIDRVTYDDGPDYPNAQAASISFTGELLGDADAGTYNDNGVGWCLGTEVYGSDPEHRGSPGALNRVCDRCDPNPCTMPPAAACEGNRAITYAPVGLCSTSGIELVCEYQPAQDNCENDEVCVAGVCAPEGVRAPNVGEVIVNEVMYDPTEVRDADGEWFELYNISADPISLQGCTVGDRGDTEDLSGLFLRPNSYALMVRTLDSALNGGLEGDHAFGFSLNNGGDTITLACNGNDIDVLTYGRDEGFPDEGGRSISLDPASANAEANDESGNWCLGGTPGAANAACP